MGTLLSDRAQLDAYWQARQPVWAADPVLWNTEVLGAGEPWSRQVEILRAIAKYDEVNVASGHAIGKDWLMARVVLWFLLTRPNSVVLTTAPTEKQVTTILWGEIRRAWHGSKFLAKVIKADLHDVDPMLRISEGWYAKGIVARERNALQGFHSSGGGVLVVIDEAAGVPDWAFEALDGVSTGVGSKIVRIGNPTVPTPLHPFARAFGDTDPLVKNVVVSSLETPNFLAGKSVIPGLFERKDEARHAKRYGRGSDVYRAKVLGRFPTGSSDSLITPEHIAAGRERWHADASARDTTPIVRIGGDVARFGDDRTVFAVLVGNRCFIPSNGFLDKADGVRVARHAAALARQYGAVSVALDGGGLGGGAVDSLVELQRQGVLGANVQIYDNEFGASSSEKGEWANRRTELHWRLRDWMWDTGAMDPDVDTEEELLSATYKVAARGNASILEPKEKIKARLGRSPDRADALALAVAGHVGRVRQRGQLVLHWW